MWTCEFYLFIGLILVMTSALDSELFSKPTLTVEPSASVWEMDSVSLSCQSESKVTGTRLTYRFYRENNTVSQETLENVFRINVAFKDNSGSYWCEVGSEEKRTEKKRSDPVQVTVRENPKATLTIRNDSKNVYIGDTVTLDCSIEGSFTDWKYLWYKRNLTNWGNWIKDGTGNAYTFQSATLSKSGEYWCSAYRDVPPPRPLKLGGYDSPRRSQGSNVVTLTVKAMNVTLEPSPSRSVKLGDPLNLTCIWRRNQSSDSRLTFSFLQNNMTVEHSRESSVLSITGVEKRHGGSYMCAAESPGGGKSYSEAIEIEVQEFPLTIVLVSVGLALFLLLLLLLLFVCHRTRGKWTTQILISHRGALFGL
uniref:Ig-like domain-containing protein n=1 Tax=Erpetoichthys calabaricus TaxID=27687 RepID=A0A8C4SVP4_ERPCA